MKQDYEKMNEAYRHKCLIAFKFIFNKYYYIFKNKNIDIRQKMLKETIVELLTDINSIKILLFNLTVIDG
jgi:hypothetical protein